MTICERMFSIMEQQGKRAADLCKLLGIGTSQTTAWKQRNSDPPAKYIMQISQFLNVTPEFLLTGTTAMPMAHSREEEMLTMFRQLPEMNQDFIYDSIKVAYEREMEAKVSEGKLSG